MAGPAPRLKRYEAASGYVYEYFHAGGHVFHLSADRKRWRDVALLVPEDARLSSTERYAVAKLALFEAFDQAETPAELSAAIAVDAEQLGRILESLGIPAD
jgi:hypothetical protein